MEEEEKIVVVPNVVEVEIGKGNGECTWGMKLLLIPATGNHLYQPGHNKEPEILQIEIQEDECRLGGEGKIKGLNMWWRWNQARRSEHVTW